MAFTECIPIGKSENAEKAKTDFQDKQIVR